MKQLPVILIVMLIGLSVFAAFRITGAYVESHQSAWQVEAAAKAVVNVQLYQVEAQESAKRAMFWTQGYQTAFGMFVALVIGGFCLYSWKVIDERTESKARMADGSYALQTFKNAQGQQWTVDPNKSQFGAIGFDKSSGQLVTDAAIVGPDRQLAYVQAIQRTRTASAVTSGDGFKYAATGKYLGGAYDKNDMPALPMMNGNEPDPVSTWQTLTAQDAFQMSTQAEWILGQNMTTGELFKFTPRESFGIVGSPGVGKTTYAAQMCFALALKSKYRCILLDGKNGGDWSRFAQWADYADIDYSNVMGYLDNLTGVYKSRQAMLKQYDANSIWELRDKGAKVPQPILVICDEFGSVADGMKAASKSEYAKFELAIGNLLRLGRAAGIFMTFCDQNPAKWCNTMRGVLTTNLCFRLGGAVGNSVGEYNLNQLDRVGEFQVQGQRYSGFPTWEVIDQLLPDVTSYKKPLALLTIDSSVNGDKNGGVSTGHNTTPQAITSDAVTALVTSGDTGEHRPQSSTGDSGDKAVTAPVLTGKPITTQHRQQVLNIYAMTGSKNETMRLVWGGKNQQRAAWLNELLASQVQQ